MYSKGLRGERLRIGLLVGYNDYGNEMSVSIKRGFLQRLRENARFIKLTTPYIQ